MQYTPLAQTASRRQWPEDSCMLLAADAKVTNKNSILVQLVMQDELCVVTGDLARDVVMCASEHR